jgi:SAM-dependent methyltransferase
MSDAFDSYAEDYDAALARGVSVSGEDKDFFAHGRIDWLGRCLQTIGARPQSVLDFGCGTGGAAPIFVKALGASRVIGVDPSAKSIERATATHHAPGIRFETTKDYRPCGDADLGFCNGVFHHIPPASRAEALEYVHASLGRDGLFAFWENNPWNPGTRYVMSRIPFDRDAQTLSVIEAMRMLSANGFDILRTDFLFIFPRSLRMFRPIEPYVAKLPLGTQYQVLCRKR